jgi:hypothetical protein
MTQNTSMSEFAASRALYLQLILVYAHACSQFERVYRAGTKFQKDPAFYSAGGGVAESVSANHLALRYAFVGLARQISSRCGIGLSLFENKLTIAAVMITWTDSLRSSCSSTTSDTDVAATLSSLCFLFGIANSRLRQISK